MGKVVVFGSFVVDLMARSPHLPVPGETVKGSMFKMGPGGKGFNQCVAAHKAGADVVMVTKLGKDSFANVATDTMDELRMPKDGLFFAEETETGIALILVDENTSQNEIIIVPGACNTITDAEVDSIEERIKESEYVLLQLEVNQDANERVVDMVNRYGCKVIVNTAPYSQISDEFLSKVYMVTPNEVEAEELTGIHVEDLESAHKAAEYFYEKGVEKVIITLDPEACLFPRTVRKRSFRHLKWTRWIRPGPEMHSTEVCWRHCQKERISGKRFGLQTDWRRFRYKN